MVCGVRTQMLVVIGTDCIGSCKSNYHTPPEKIYIASLFFGPTQFLVYVLSRNAYASSKRSGYGPSVSP
jgi:hypothetical protein